MELERIEKKQLFTVHAIGSEIEEIRGRMKAVEVAKEISEPGREVRIEREDGEIEMLFYSGSLEFLRDDTASRRRRRNRRKRRK